MEADIPEIPLPAAATTAVTAMTADALVADGPVAAIDGAEEPAAERPAPRWGWALVGAWVALVAAANVGTIVSPSLQKRSPALLLALSARNRHLLLAIGNDVSPLAYAVVSTVRLTAAALVCYGLGRAFGPRALHWLRVYTGMPKASIAKMEQGFEAVSWFLVPFMVGSNIVAMLAGQRPLPLRRFLALIAVGIAARLALFWFLAEQLRGPLNTFVRISTRFQWPLMAVLLVWVVGSNAVRFRRGRNG